jgi:hypothetical protein
MHLELIVEARKEGLNQLYISTDYHKKQFIESLAPTIKRLKKDGYPEKSIADYCSGLFEGLNRQIYNTPIDLFIENFLFSKYKEFPLQLLSLYSIINEGIQAVTKKKLSHCLLPMFYPEVKF